VATLAAGLGRLARGSAHKVRKALSAAKIRAFIMVKVYPSQVLVCPNLPWALFSLWIFNFATYQALNSIFDGSH
jgi:hypothetical protein